MHVTHGKALCSLAHKVQRASLQQDMAVAMDYHAYDCRDTTHTAALVSVLLDESPGDLLFAFAAGQVRAQHELLSQRSPGALAAALEACAGGAAPYDGFGCSAIAGALQAASLAAVRESDAAASRAVVRGVAALAALRHVKVSLLVEAERAFTASTALQVGACCRMAVQRRGAVAIPGCHCC
jgi:hypothetical protein